MRITVAQVCLFMQTFLFLSLVCLYSEFEVQEIKPFGWKSNLLIFVFFKKTSINPMIMVEHGANPSTLVVFKASSRGT